MDSTNNITIKKGQIIRSERYGWTRKITKISRANEEVELRNLDPMDIRTYTFSLPNVLKQLESGIYTIQL